MSRYLTAPKIALLCLIDVYTAGFVPSSHTVRFLTFLVDHISPRPFSSSDFSLPADSYVVEIQDFEKEFSPLPSAVPGRTVWDLFLKRLWSLDCSHALAGLLSQALSHLDKSAEQLREEHVQNDIPTVPVPVSRASPLGAFVRRAYLEYDRLQFSETAKLWPSFVRYRQSTKAAFEKKNGAVINSHLDSNLSALQIDESHPWIHMLYGDLEDGADQADDLMSDNDKQTLMEFQVSELQRFGGRLEEKMAAKLSTMLSSKASTPTLGHYLKFLDSWREGDYASAFDNLHRYFDHTKTHDRASYQYALLNLAILHADFGCHQEAIPAMREAIATARENEDLACLNFCMSWLYHFSKAFPGQMKDARENGMLGSEHEALAHLKTKAKDTEMWSLLSTSFLSEAKAGLQNGESIAAAFETIAKSAHLNVAKGITSLQGPNLLMRSSVYARVGLTHLAWSGSETFLKCYRDEVPAEDILKCTCRMANLLVQQGRYEKAFEMMEQFSEQILRVLKYYQYWTFFFSLLKLRRHLHRDELSIASDFVSRLRGQGPPDLELSLSLSLLSIDLHVRNRNFDLALDEVEAVAQSSEFEAGDILAQIKMLNLKARILAQCGHPYRGFSITMRAASMAHSSRLLPSLWESTSILANILMQLHDFTAAVQLLEAMAPRALECQDSNLAATIHALLADAYMGLAGQEEGESEGDYATKTQKEGRQSTINILAASATAPTTTAASKTTSESKITRVNPASPSKQLEYLHTATECLDSALQHYAHIEDLHGQLTTLIKKATVLRVRGDDGLANDMASRYLDLKRQWHQEQEEEGK